MSLKEPGQIREAYSATETAERYIDERFTSAWASVMHTTQVRAVNEAIRTHGAKTVLEVAPGPARLSVEVSGFSQGYLCEFNHSMATVAHRRLRGAHAPWRLVRGDGFRLPFRDETVDLVYTFRFIRHFEAADRAAIYAQLRAVLRPRGLLVFDAINADIDPAAKPGAPARPIYDVFYRRGELEDELRRHGFTVRRLIDVIRHFTLQHWLQIYVAPRSNGLACSLIAALEGVPGDPLEWVVIAEKTRAVTTAGSSPAVPRR